MKSYLLSLICLIAFACFSDAQTETEIEYNKEYAQRIQLSRIDGVYIPKDIDDAFEELTNLSDPQGILKFKTASEDDVKTKLQGGLGRWMLINWGFYNGSRLSHHLKSLGVHHPEDMSQLLLVSYHRHLTGKPLDVESQVIVFQKARKKEFEARKKRDKEKIVKQ